MHQLKSLRPKVEVHTMVGQKSYTIPTAVPLTYTYLVPGVEGVLTASVACRDDVQ